MTKATTAIIRTAFAAALAAGVFAISTQGAAAFNIKTETQDRPSAVMAYAAPMEERFGPAPEAESADHELNDAWLGMSVRASNGEMLGYVVDALVGPEGEITDIVIASGPGSDVEIFIPAILATLNDEDVRLSLSESEVAAIRSASRQVLASN